MSSGSAVASNELETVRKESVTTELKALFQNLRRGTGEKHRIISVMVS